MTTRLATFPVKHPSAALLFVQIIGILLYPLMGDTSAERALFGVIGLLVLGAALYVVKRGPWLTVFRRHTRTSRGWPFHLAGVPLRSPQNGHLGRARGRVLFLRNGQLDCLHARGRIRNGRRIVRRWGDVHAAGLGIRLCVRGVPGPPAG